TVDAGQRLDLVRLGRRGELVLVGDRGHLGGAGGKRRDARLAEVRSVGVADPVTAPGPDPDPGLGRRGEALDLAAVDPHLAPAVARRVRLGGRRPGAERGLDRAARGRGQLDVGQVAAAGHLAVPPTVIWPTRTCPWPVPTGTFWPPLPQIPVFMKKSSPTASIAASASRQLPISVAPVQGLVTLPSSIR